MRKLVIWGAIGTLSLAALGAANRYINDHYVILEKDSRSACEPEIEKFLYDESIALWITSADPFISKNREFKEANQELMNGLGNAIDALKYPEQNISENTAEILNLLAPSVEKDSLIRPSCYAYIKARLLNLTKTALIK